MAVPTATVAVALLPRESVAWTTSVTLVSAPAVKSPVEESEAPERFWSKDHAMPTPLPPRVASWREALGARAGDSGSMRSSGPMST